jgi:hypothetical protein
MIPVGCLLLNWVGMAAKGRLLFGLRIYLFCCGKRRVQTNTDDSPKLLTAQVSYDNIVYAIIVYTML